jgi:hypothetical protein
MDIEEWKFVEGYEGLYEVSNLGQVKSYHSNKILKPKVNPRGYLCVNFYKDKKQSTKIIHKLVALAFIPNINDKPFIDHINRVKTDNRAVNLRWVTPQENNFNLSKPKDNKSGYTGVGWLKSRNKYYAEIKANGKKIHGGLFDNLEDAIKRRDELKQQYHFIGVNSSVIT